MIAGRRRQEYGVAALEMISVRATASKLTARDEREGVPPCVRPSPLREASRRGLEGAETFIVGAGLGIVAALKVVARPLTPHDHRDALFAQGDLRVDLERADQIDVAGTDVEFHSAPDRPIVRPLLFLDRLEALDSFVAVENTVTRVNELI